MKKETIIRYHLHSGRLAAEKRRTQTASIYQVLLLNIYKQADGTSV